MSNELEEKEYVSLRVRPSVAKEVKALESQDEIERWLIKHVETTRKEFIAGIECLDEDLLVYKATLLKAKHAFKDAYADYRESNYKLWEDFQKDCKSTKTFVDTAVATLEPLKRELTEINDLMRTIQKWELEKLLELMERIAGMDGKTKAVLQQALGIYAERAQTA